MKKFKYFRLCKKRGCNFINGNFKLWVLKSINSGYILKRQVVSITKLLERYSKKFKFNLTLKFRSTKKSLDSRMGGGKGLLQEEKSFVKKGSILMEFWDISSRKVFYFAKIINNKLSINLRLLKII